MAKLLKIKVKRNYKEAGIVFLLFFVFYLFFQTKGIFGGDAGDLVAAASLWGIPHPPSYPLWTFLVGLLIRIVPFFTPAWRAALLSSFFSAASLGLFFVLLRKLLAHLHQYSVIPAKAAGIYKNKNYLYRFLVKPGMTIWLVSLVTTLTLAFSYLFWLYAEVAEVFGLNSFFVILLTFLVLEWYYSPTRFKFCLFSFFFGLSLTHHHTVLFLLPAFLYLFWRKEGFLLLGTHPALPPGAASRKMRDRQGVPLSLFFFFLGLLPYLYLPLAARANPAVDWGHPTDLLSFIKVVTRSIYGTFSSNPAAGQEAGLRLFQIPSYFIFLNLNISTLGIILAIIGMVYLFFKNKILFWFFALAFLTTGPFFVFYASFPLNNRFLLATFERFVLLSLPFVMVFFAFGVLLVARKLSAVISFLRKKRAVSSMLGSIEVNVQSYFIVLLFLLIPAFLFRANLSKMAFLKNDFSADNLGKDILDTVERDSILLLAYDNPLFNAQYVHYACHYRRDVKLVHLFLLKYSYYRDWLKEAFPELVISEKKEVKEFLREFLEENYSRFSIYSNIEIIESGWREPRGLLLKYHQVEENLPDNAEIIKRNRELWESYQDLDPLMKKDYFLMPLSLVDFYATSRKRVAKLYLDAGLYKQALEQFIEAQKLMEDDETFLYTGLLRAKLGQCVQAENDLQKALYLNEVAKEKAYYLLFLNARDCWQDEERAKEYEELWKNAQ